MHYAETSNAMGLPIFPFYLEEQAFHFSIFWQARLAFAKYQNDLRETKDERPPETAIYQTLLELLKRSLSDNYFQIAVGIMKELHKGLDPAFDSAGNNLTSMFIYCKNCVLNDKAPDEDQVNILYESMRQNNKEKYYTCFYLLECLDFDLNTIESCFQKINSMSSLNNLRNLFADITTTGMRTFICLALEALPGKFDTARVKFLRMYIERFCMYIELMGTNPHVNNQGSSSDLMLRLMKAAYDDGKIVREMEFYEDKSLKIMATLGNNFTRTDSRLEDYVHIQFAKEFIESVYAQGSILSTNNMTELVSSIESYKDIPTYKIKELIRAAKKKYGLDDRRNNRIIKKNHPDVNND